MMAEPGTHDAPSGDGQSTTDLARQQGGAAKEETRQQAQEVAGTTRDEAGRVAQEASARARDLAVDARDQLHQQARHQTEQLGDAIYQFGDRTHALADGRAEEAGPVRDYASRIGDHAEQLSARVDELGFDGLIDEVQRFARRRPGAFLAGAAVAGFAVSRLGAGAKAADDDTGGPAGGSATERSTAPAASGARATGSGPETPSAGPDTSEPVADRDPSDRPDPLRAEQVRR